jgi:hypothetical protein
MYDCNRSVVITEALTQWQLYNAYHVPATSQEMIARKFTGQFWHTHSIVLKNKMEAGGECHLLVDFKTESFSVLATRNGEVLLAQIYSYTAAEDVLYYLLKICRQFSLSQREVQLTLSGLIEKDSAMFKELYQYFLNIQFASQEKDLRLSEAFNEYPVHFFSSLFKLATCVS